MGEKKSNLIKLSRKTHKWIGIVAGLWIVAMGVSGVALNHQELLAGFDLPRSAMPEIYSYSKWNRNALRSKIVGVGGEQYIFGEAGVMRLRNGRFDLLDDGFERSAYYKDTRALLLTGDVLYAVTRGGLYVAKPSGASPVVWDRVELPGRTADLTDIVELGDQVAILSRSELFVAPAGSRAGFERVVLRKLSEPDMKLNLFRLVFSMHSGQTWGLPGILLFDLLGIATVFLTVSGGWFWYRKKRRTLTEGRSGKLVRSWLGHHIKIGLYLGPLLVFMIVTGFFQRPPFLIAIAEVDYPASMHPAPLDPNPWHDSLRKGLYDRHRRTLVLSTSHGIYEGGADLTGEFKPVGGGPPISVMGATVFRHGLGGDYVVGSMSGLFRWNRWSGSVTNAHTGFPPAALSGMPVGQRKVVGYYEESNGDWYWADYDSGLMDVADRPVPLPMPGELAEGGRMSLWHALFEFHNGRIFQPLLGWWTWIVVPLGGLIMLASVLTGLYDNLYPKFRKMAK